MRNLVLTVALALAFVAQDVSARQKVRQSPDTLTVMVGGVEFKMVKVEGGRFVMGAYNTIKDCSDEKNMHFVTLSDYYMGETEVSQELWLEVMVGNPSVFNQNTKNPVDNVSWKNCVEFIYKLNERTGLKFRMPTEAEWEFAARGGNKSHGYNYSGADQVGKVAWYKYNAHLQTHKVGTKAPNELGLYDMTGNVWEFCSDWYKAEYELKEVVDPKGPETGNQKVSRGGAWFTDTTLCRITYRNVCTPSQTGNGLGLRLALTNTMAGLDRSITMNHDMEGWDNQNFAFCYRTKDGVYNMRSYKNCGMENVVNAKVSPAGYALAVESIQEQKRRLGVYSALDGTCFHEFANRRKSSAVAFAFTADAREIAVVYENGEMVMYDMATYKETKSVKLPFVPERWAVSRNKYYVAAAKGDSVYVYNCETGALRRAIKAGARVKSVAFGMNSGMMALTTEGGKMELYETRRFERTRTIGDLGEARECVLHPDGKYISVLTSERRITIVNLKDEAAREYVDVDAGGIDHLGCAWALSGKFYLVYNTRRHLIFSSVDYLVPNYQKIVADSVNAVIMEWQKQRRGETDWEYCLRVNDETRRAKYIELEREISTAIADNIVDEAKVTIGAYDAKNRVVEVRFDNMPPIKLEIKSDEMVLLGNAEDLMFSNSWYRVDDKDNFELMYTEVTNRKTGKKFIYDANNKRVFEEEYMEFVPIEIVRQTSADEIKLEIMKDSIVNKAMELNQITDKTHVSVKTYVEPTVNADGEKIMNYHIDFGYYVEKEYSTRDDYKVGQYECEQSEAAMAMLRCVAQAFREQFAQYLVAGKRVVITLQGSADAIPIKRVIKYDGRCGEYTNSLIYNKGELETITVTKETGITTNEQLAYLRAASVRRHVEANVEMRDMEKEYTYNISVSSESGSEYRRIGVRFMFVDTFGR